MTLSVALCTYNGEAFLAHQLESIARQTRLPDELVVCDDGSDDQTAALVRQFAKRAKFEVSLCVNATRLGVTQNFAKAFSLCKGDVIVPCDQDDVWEPEKLATLDACFRDDPSVLLAFHDLAIIRSDATPVERTQWQRLGFGPRLQRMISRGHAFEVLLRFNVVTGAAMAFRSSVRKCALPIAPAFLHDEWIALIAAAAGRVACIDRPLVGYRQHAGQAIGASASSLVGQYRHARARMGRSYFAQMIERTRGLHERLAAKPEEFLRAEYLSMVEEKMSHAQARLRMRDQALIRWPLAIGEAVRGRYGRFGYGFKSFLQDLVL